jgi:molybdenum cofactor cytidylyltransferase/nicotine blue oxidoreductase
VTVAGLLLAAGAGRRMGRPKALLVDHDGAPLAGRVVERLREAGCARVTVVLGAAAEEATALLRPYDVEVVVAENWDAGMGASLRRGLDVLRDTTEAQAALVTLVDLPDVDARVMARVLDAGRAGDLGGTLARATYDGRPGHPVLIGRDHWSPLITTLDGDEGARGYLSGHDVVEVSCDDLATGHDVDRPEQLLGRLDGTAPPGSA